MLLCGGPSPLGPVSQPLERILKGESGMPEPEKTLEPTTSQAESEPVDVRAIRHLVRLMKRYDLTAIDFIEGPTDPDPPSSSRSGALGRLRPGVVDLRAAASLGSAPPGPRGNRAACPFGNASRSQGDRDREPDGGDVLFIQLARYPSVCQRGLDGSSRLHRLHHRGHESLHRYPGWSDRNHRRSPGQERPVGRVRVNLCSASPLDLAGNLTSEGPGSGSIR